MSGFTKMMFSLTALLFSLAGAANVPQVINIGNGSEPKDLDPHIVTGIPETQILRALFEGLAGKDPKSLAPTPEMAESWKISKDGKTYTFKIRSNAKWSNGDPLTSADFVYSWTRLLKPEIASQYAQMGFYIKNGKDFNSGKITDASLLGMKTPDASTFVVELENPTPFFLSILSHHSLYPVHKATVEKFGARWTRSENIVSNGAFKLEKWEMNKIISVVPNPLYWDKDRVKLTKVNYFPVEKAETEEKMFRAKELHATHNLPLEKIPYWQKEGSWAYIQNPYLGVYFYWFNTTKAPLNNKLVRKALTLAIDRERIVKYITQAGQDPALFFVPPGAGGYQPEAKLPKDLSRIAEAKALLEKAGFKDGKGLPSIEILYNTLDAHKKIAEAIQQMWKINLGINVTLLNQEWKVYLDSERTGNYQISRAGWIGDYNDPNTFLDMFVTGSALNHARFSNPAYDALIETAAKESNSKKRLGHFKKAEAILLEELPVLPIYIYTRVHLLDPKVKGWYPNVEDFHPLKYVSIAP